MREMQQLRGLHAVLRVGRNEALHPVKPADDCGLRLG